MSDGTGQHYGGLDLLAKMMTPEGLAAVERDQQERAARMWELERTVSRQADEIERLEAIVKGLEECDAEDKAEIARLRAALDEAENALLDYVPRLEAYGNTMGYGRGVLRKIREALNDE